MLFIFADIADEVEGVRMEEVLVVESDEDLRCCCMPRRLWFALVIFWRECVIDT